MKCTEFTEDGGCDVQTEKRFHLLPDSLDKVIEMNFPLTGQREKLSGVRNVSASSPQNNFSH